MPKRLFILLAMTMLVAIAVVQTRHESRQLFAELQARQAERDALNTEWGKLLLEEATWSQPRRVEAMARARLGMNTPETANIRIVRVNPGAAP